MRLTKSVAPNLLTLANLYCGFSAIIFVAEGDFHKAALFIFLAAIFDMLDGVTARLVGSTSELGAEMDSLCDVVSFGVAPAFMLYKAYFNVFGEFGILFASLPAIAGAFRLARFNIIMTGFEDKKYFHGLPIPASALIIVSYLIYYQLTPTIPEEWKPYIITFVVIGTTLAMVSRIKYDNLPRPTIKSIRQRPIIFTLFLIGFVISAITLGKAVFPFMLFYLIGSALRHFIFWLKEVQLPEDEIDETPETDPTPFD
ncbi:MAG: CDP-diacylglycerol---serine O-phosphatidyltransferase [Bacteroidota bacterium]|nr:CDP-diacylglycerol---serine O-phosphatidyltransferase [Bacteroidota bacterium]